MENTNTNEKTVDLGYTSKIPQTIFEDLRLLQKDAEKFLDRFSVVHAQLLDDKALVGNTVAETADDECYSMLQVVIVTRAVREFAENLHMACRGDIDLTKDFIDKNITDEGDTIKDTVLKAMLADLMSR